jgi:hypothetical protein
MSDRATGYAVPAANDWDLVEQVGALRNVPVRNFTGTYDALVPAGHDSRRFCDELKARQIDHVCWRDISPGGTHRGFEADRAEDIARLMDRHVRVANPDSVSYQVHPVWVQQARDKGIGGVLRYDSAYWVSGIVHQPSGVPEDLDCRVKPLWSTGFVYLWRDTCFGRLDATTLGLGLWASLGVPVGDDPSPFIMRDGTQVFRYPYGPRQNHFRVHMANIAAFDLDLDRMGLSLAEPLLATITGEQTGPIDQTRPTGSGPLRLGLIGPGAHEGCSATMDGRSVPVSVDGSRLVLDLVLTGPSRQLEVHCS